MRYLIYTFVLILTFGIVYAAGDLILDDGNTVENGDLEVTYTNSHDEAYSSQNKLVLFNTDTADCIQYWNADTGDLLDRGLQTTSTEETNWSLVGVYDGDTTGCWACSNDYDGCVASTFYDEYTFTVLAPEAEPSSTPSSTPNSTTTMTEFEMQLSYYMLLMLIFIVAGAVYSLVRPQ